MWITIIFGTPSLFASKMERIGLWALRKELDGLKHERRWIVSFIISSCCFMIIILIGSDLKDLISMTLKASDTFSALKTTYLNRLKLVDKKLSKNFLDYLQVLTEDEKKPFGRIIFYGELRGKMVEKSFKCVLDISESAMVIDKAFQVEVWLVTQLFNACRVKLRFFCSHVLT